MATPRHIYTVRHCEREDDVNKVWFYNSRFLRDNPPLSVLGRKQAEDLKEAFHAIHIDYCFSSPYERCIQTAAKILEGRQEPYDSIHIEPGLLESGHLIRESGETRPSFSTPKQLVQRYPNVNLKYRPVYLAPDAIEYGDAPHTVRACFKRVQNTFEHILKKCQGDILIVSHQGPLAAIQEYLLGDREPFFPGQATVSKYVEQLDLYVVGEGTKFVSDYLCDSSHLSNSSRSGNLRGKCFNRKK